jgi:hypothetical protein
MNNNGELEGKGTALAEWLEQLANEHTGSNVTGSPLHDRAEAGLRRAAQFIRTQLDNTTTKVDVESLLRTANTLLAFPIEKQELEDAVDISLPAVAMYGGDQAINATVSLLNTTQRGTPRSQGYSLDEARRFGAVLDLVRAAIAQRQKVGQDIPSKARSQGLIVEFDFDGEIPTMPFRVRLVDSGQLKLMVDANPTLRGTYCILGDWIQEHNSAGLSNTLTNTPQAGTPVWFDFGYGPERGLYVQELLYPEVEEHPHQVVFEQHGLVVFSEDTLRKSLRLQPTNS